MEDEMTDQRFADLALRHGGDLDFWPAGLRAAARAAVDRSAAARAALAEARRLDAEIAGALAACAAPASVESAASPSAALMARILADAAAMSPAPVASPPREKPQAAMQAARLAAWLRGLSPGMLRPAAFAASAFVGVALGYAAPTALTSTLLEAATAPALGQDYLTAELLPEIDALPAAGLTPDP